MSGNPITSITQESIPKSKESSLKIPESTGRSGIPASILDIENKIHDDLKRMLSQFQIKMPSSLIDFLKGIILFDDEHIKLYQKLNLVKIIHFIDI